MQENSLSRPSGSQWATSQITHLGLLGNPEYKKCTIFFSLLIETHIGTQKNNFSFFICIIWAFGNSSSHSYVIFVEEVIKYNLEHKINPEFIIVSKFKPAILYGEAEP